MEESDKKLEINIFPKLWITNWVDYTTKYGLGYKFNNGNYGILFNDRTTILLITELNIFYYIENRKYNKEEGAYHEYTFDNYPKEINNKVILFKHFKNHIDEQSKKEKEKNIDKNIDNNKDINENKEEKENIDNNNEIDDNKKEPFIFMRSWMITKSAILFRFIDKTMQVVFQDDSQLIVFNKNHYITYINKKREKVTYLLSKALVINNREFKVRLKYLKDQMRFILEHYTYNYENNNRENIEEMKIKENEPKEKTKEIKVKPEQIKD